MKAFQKLLGLTVVLLLLSVVLGLEAPLRCALHAAASPALVLKGAKMWCWATTQPKMFTISQTFAIPFVRAE